MAGGGSIGESTPESGLDRDSRSATDLAKLRPLVDGFRDM